ncbi:c-type heme family protein [Thermovibrio sp.]
MKFKDLSISQKVFLVFLIVVALATFSFLHLLRKTYDNALVSQGRSIAEEILIFRKWAATFGGVWSLNNYTPDVGYLMELKSDKGVLKAYNTGEVLGNLSNVHFYLHNPALATRELSKLSNIEYGWSFRAVSDRWMAKWDKPDKWEEKAIKIMEKENKDEFWSWDGDKFRFAKAIRIKKSCLRCHGTKDEINPMFYKAMVAKYGEEAVKRATGYKVGELRGIISVTILPASLLSMSIKLIDIWNIGALIAAFLIFWYFAKSQIIKPIEKLTKAAHDISLGKLDIDLGVRGLKEEEVKDEITKLAIAIDRLRASIQIAMERLRKKR